MHLGFILGDYSEREFERVLARLEARKRLSDWVFDAYPITSMVASSHDERIIILENDRQVAEGLLIRDVQPLGPHVYILHGPDDGLRGMEWQAITYDGSGAQADHDLTRVGTDRAFGKVIGQHSHPGMIFAFTNLPSQPDSRSGRNFVIMS